MARWRAKRPRRRLKEEYQAMGRKGGARLRDTAPEGYFQALGRRSGEVRRALAAERPRRAYRWSRVNLYRDQWEALLLAQEETGVSRHKVVRQLIDAWIAERQKNGPNPDSRPGSGR